MSSGIHVRVAVNGYGVIGKRVADAVALQDDMTLVGVADVAADYRMKVAVERGYPVYASTPEARTAMEAAGIPVAGPLQDLLKQAAVVVDCTPKGAAARHAELYHRAEVKAVFQGGEKHNAIGCSFVAQVNYSEALNRQAARVVSCNTTALCRVSDALKRPGLVKRVRAVLMRRATDPWESHLHGMINTVVPETKVPSHQGPDARSVMPDLDITTIAATGPFNLSHIHVAMIETTRPVSRDEIRKALLAVPRIAFVRAREGMVALSSVMELMRDIGRPRSDMWEVAVWEDAIAIDEHDVYLTFQVHNEAIVIPEVIDCIRALTGVERNAAESIRRTDAALGVTKFYLPSTEPPLEQQAVTTVPNPDGTGIAAPTAPIGR